MLESLPQERHGEQPFYDWVADRCVTYFDPRFAARERLALIRLHDPLISNPLSPSTFARQGALGAETPFGDSTLREFFTAFRVTKHSPRLDHLDRAAQDATQPEEYRVRALQAMSVCIALRDLTVGAEISEPPAHVSALDYLADAIDEYIAQPAFTRAQMLAPFDDGGACSPTNPVANAWLTVFSAFNLRRLMDANYFVPIGAQPNQSLSVEDQNLRRLALRSKRADTCVQWALCHPFLAELVPVLEFLVQPDVQHQLHFRILDIDRLDQFVAKATEIMARPFEDLHNYSMTYARTRERMTDDGLAYPHTGLPPWVFEGYMEAEAIDARATAAASTDFAAHVDESSVVSWLLSVFQVAEAACAAYWGHMLAWRGPKSGDKASQGDLEPLEQAAGAGALRAAADYPLCDPQEEIISVDGLGTSAPVSSYADLCLRVTVPARFERNNVLTFLTGFGRQVAYMSKDRDGLTAADDSIIGDIPLPAIAIPVRSRMYTGELRRSSRVNPRIFTRSSVMRTGAELVTYDPGPAALVAAYNMTEAAAISFIATDRLQHPQDWAHLYDDNGQLRPGRYWCVTSLTRALTYVEHAIPEYPHSRWVLFFHSGLPVAARRQLLEVRYTRRAAVHPHSLAGHVKGELDWIAAYVGDLKEGLGGQAETQAARQAAAGRITHNPTGGAKL